jgi:PAS domain S-box-containing protein
MELLQVPFLFATTFAVVLAAVGGIWVTVSRPELVPQGLGRIGFGVGWLLLGVAESIHGALLIDSEITDTAIALRAGAYAILVLSMLAARKGVATVAVVVTQTAFMPSFLAAAGAWVATRSRLLEARRLALAFLLFGASELIFGLGGAGSAEEAGALWVSARLLRLLGAVALGVWLWQGFRTSIQLRFVAVLVILSMVVVVLISSAMTQVFATNVRTDARNDSVREGEAQKLIMEEQRREAVQDAKQAAGSEIVQRAVAARDPILGQIATNLEGPGGLFESADFLAFFAPTEAGASILAFSAAGRESGAPPQLTDIDATALAGTDVVVSAIGGVQAASVDLVGEEKIALVGAFPILRPAGLDPPGTPIGIAGAVALGRVIDSGYLETLSLRSGLEFSLLSQEGVFASTLPNPERLARSDLRRVFEDRLTITGEERFGGIDYFSSYVPLERADGRIVGALVVSSQSEVIALTQKNVGRILFVLVLVAAAVAAALSFLSGSRVTKPIVELIRASDRVRRGDLRSRVSVKTGDEIAILGETFNEMTASMARLTGDLRRTAEQELELRTRLETIVQSMTDGLLAIDAEARVVTLNREAERILNVSIARARGRPIQDVLQLKDSAGSKLNLPIYNFRRGTVDGAFSDSQDGESLPVAMTSAPIEDEGRNVVGAVAVVRDLTPQLEVERMKTEFLANISHELRTPLTPIKGYADIMRRKSVPRRQALGFLDNMITSIGRLERIVDMLVDVSSMEAGRLTPRTVPLDLEKTVSTLVDRWKRSAPKHQFVRRGFRQLPTLKLDERLIPRAIDELIDNAVKFSPKGGRVIVSGELQSSQNGRIAKISVADEGVGLSDEQLSEIFEDFVQGDASATREYGGLGIGLAYVRRIAEAHGGTLEAERIQERGARFSIVLPVANGSIMPSSSKSGTRQKAPASDKIKSSTSSNSRTRSGRTKRKPVTSRKR